jgi:hypothetical protein
MLVIQKNSKISFYYIYLYITIYMVPQFDNLMPLLAGIGIFGVPQFDNLSLLCHSSTTLCHSSTAKCHFVPQFDNLVPQFDSKIPFCATVRQPCATVRQVCATVRQPFAIFQGIYTAPLDPLLRLLCHSSTTFFGIFSHKVKKGCTST